MSKNILHFYPLKLKFSFWFLIDWFILVFLTYRQAFIRFARTSFMETAATQLLSDESGALSSAVSSVGIGSPSSRLQTSSSRRQTCLSRAPTPYVSSCYVGFRMIWVRCKMWQLSAGIMRILTASGLFLAFCSIWLLTMAISTDYWYETDARKHRDRCRKYASKRNDPGYIYISNQNLPLRMRPQAAPLRESLHPAPAMESRCSRRYNSTTTGLWRKCHREGFDLENEDLIFKGDDADQALCEQQPDSELILNSCSVFVCLLSICEWVLKNAWRYPGCWSLTSTLDSRSCSHIHHITTKKQKQMESVRAAHGIHLTKQVLFFRSQRPQAILIKENTLVTFVSLLSFLLIAPTTKAVF